MLHSEILLVNYFIPCKLHLLTLSSGMKYDRLLGYIWITAFDNYHNFVIFQINIWYEFKNRLFLYFFLARTAIEVWWFSRYSTKYCSASQTKKAEVFNQRGKYNITWGVILMKLRYLILYV